ncbi:TOM1-like protein [Vigna angularis]|uniref:TOM1-like protein n=1 Tax=Phaseolus angularis TaxID=3914 RepID=A0A8T0LG97_PHAAN|nr:TOM1-like protein [Vigna angularis]
MDEEPSQFNKRLSVKSCGKYYVPSSNVSGSSVIAMAVAIDNGVEIEVEFKQFENRACELINWFPGRDNESLAPIFTPPRSVSALKIDFSLQQQFEHDVPG